MTLENWLGLLAGLALVAVVAVLARIGLTGGRVVRERSLRFVCPLEAGPVDARIVQDAKTGQWKQVAACSAFTPPEAVDCEQECAHLMNLGRRLPHAPPA